MLNSVSIPLRQSIEEYKAGRGDAALRAQDLLLPFDFGTDVGVSAAYVRGLAQQQLGKSRQAIKEFLAVTQHRGLARKER